MMMRLLTAVALLVLLTMPVMAEVYRWVDDAGTINFTEDYGSIPPKYRASAQSDDDAIATEGVPATKQAAEAPAASPAAVNGTVKAPSAALYGGKRAEEWRDELRQARAEVKAYQDHLEMKRRMLSDTSSMGRREYLGLQADVKELETKVRELKGRLEGVERAANRAGVPASFR